MHNGNVEKVKGENRVIFQKITRKMGVHEEKENTWNRPVFVTSLAKCPSLRRSGIFVKFSGALEGILGNMYKSKGGEGC